MTGVADRARERIGELVYLDAFVPKDGQALSELDSVAARDAVRHAAKTAGDGWLVPPRPFASDVAADEVVWRSARQMPHPLATYDQPLKLTGDLSGVKRSYIYCRRKGPDDAFLPFAREAQKGDGWGYFELDSGHAPHASMPDELAALLDRIATT